MHLTGVTAHLRGRSFTDRTENVRGIRNGKGTDIWAHIYDLRAWDGFWTSPANDDTNETKNFLDDSKPSSPADFIEIFPYAFVTTALGRDWIVKQQFTPIIPGVVGILPQ